MKTENTNGNVQASPDVNASVNANNEPSVLDEFGRDAAERTVELRSVDAEMVDREVTRGKHQTYEDALAYVITRGLAEIDRQRKAAEELRVKSVLKNTRDLYANMLKLNPALVADPKFVQKMILDLGVASQK